MWPLYLALKHLFPSGKRISFFTLISITGVSLGVAVLLIVMSVMTGFHTDIRRMVTDTEGEVQIKSPQLISRYAEVVSRVKKVPGVIAATPYAAGVVGVE